MIWGGLPALKNFGEDSFSARVEMIELASRVSRPTAKAPVTHPFRRASAHPHFCRTSPFIILP